VINHLSRVLGSAVGGFSRLRFLGYQSGLFKSVRLEAKVVSIGNLSMGGTGKTPVVQAAAKHLIRQNKKVAIISRNYKAQIKTVAEVDPAHPGAAEYFGDEPTLLASTLPGVRVFVGPSKSQTAVWAEREHGPFDVVIVDDGFQHLALARDLDVVLVDATDPRGLRVVPEGRAREDRRALARADLILYTKVNWAAPEVVQEQKSLVPKDILTLDVPFLTRWPEFSEDLLVGVFSGLARSEAFAEQARKKYFARVQKVWNFSDHHRYTTGDLEILKSYLRQDPRAVLVTTEKDSVKIQDETLCSKMKIATVEAQFSEGNVFFEKLRNLVR
jgi:tetraacyldisaccharide 4'-kinase